MPHDDLPDDPLDEDFEPTKRPAWVRVGAILCLVAALLLIVLSVR